MTIIFRNDDTMRINCRVTKELSDAMHRCCVRENITRVQLIRRALRDYLKKKGEVDA